MVDQHKPTRNAIRLRFLLQNPNSPERLERFQKAEQVSFVPMEAIGEQGEFDPSMTKPAQEVSTGYTRFLEGDVLVAKITPCFENGKGAVAEGLHEGVGYGTTELHVLVPQPDKLDKRFLYYVTASPDFRLNGEAAMTGAAGQKRVPEDYVRDYRIALPPLEQQRAIAAYLDHETDRLDVLAASYRELIERLAEKRRALIAHAVTRGLDPGAPMKDSGVEWLREIPAHWRTERTRWLFRERDERSETGEEELLSVSHLTGVTPRAEKEVNMFMAETLEGYKLCRPGDLVINTMWAWMGAMGTTSIEGIVSPAYNVYEPANDLVPEYIDLLVRTRAFVDEATRYSKGVWSSRLRLYPSEFFEITMPVPPLQEQHAIVSHVKKESATLDVLRGEAERALELLAGRRAALIVEAVRGHIDMPVPEMA